MLRNEDADLLWVVHSYRKKYAKVAGVNLATYDAAIWLALGHYRRILSFLKLSRSQNVVFSLCPLSNCKSHSGSVFLSGGQSGEADGHG
jgi:hypothetical protein